MSCVLSGFHRGVVEVFALLRYAVCVDGCLPTFRVSLIGPIFNGQAVQLLNRWRWDRLGCSETVVSNYQSAMRSIPEERRTQCLVTEWLDGNLVPNHKFCIFFSGFNICRLMLTVSALIVRNRSASILSGMRDPLIRIRTWVTSRPVVSCFCVVRLDNSVF
jgi:hypothetical protein